MVDRRARAVQRAAAAPPPSLDDEHWRYSRITELDLGRFSMAPAPISGDLPTGLQALLSAVPAHGGGLVACDGFVVRRHLDDELQARGVVVDTAGALADGAAMLDGEDGEDEDDHYLALNDALVKDALVIRVPPGVVVDRPLVVVHWTEAAGSASFPRLVVEVGADAEVTVLELEASADVAGLVVPRLDLRVAPSGRLHHLVVQDLGPQMWRVGRQRITVGSQGAVVGGQIALGGDYARTRVDCHLSGRGASADLHALYFAVGAQMLDFRTFQHHEAPDTASNLLFKGAVAGHARSVYTGLIRVHPDARGTNAFQTNRNLKLGDHAWAESVPNLEIETNDVRCSHASTVGPVDAEQRFYLESRGVPPRVADRLIVAGYFDEVVRELPGGDPVVDHVRSRINDKLDAVEEDLR
jgi:Fe-S cluster assembly protein SufD